jgi:hypothetical protein
MKKEFKNFYNENGFNLQLKYLLYFKELFIQEKFKFLKMNGISLANPLP